MVVACPGWPNPRLEVPTSSSSPASGPPCLGGPQKDNLQARPPIRAQLGNAILKNYRLVTFAVAMEPSLLRVPFRSDHNARVHGQFCITRATCSDKDRTIRYWNSLSVHVGGDDNDNVAWSLVYSCPSGT